MLVLTRKSEEDIVISADGEVIVIRVLEINGKKASIGIQAGKKWQIVRKELLTEPVLDPNAYETESSPSEEPLELVGAIQN